METAYLPIIEQLPQPTRKEEIEWSKAGQVLYAENGITTTQEGATHIADLEVMKRAAVGGANITDVVAYPFITDLDKVLASNPVETWGVLHDTVPAGRTRRRNKLDWRTDLPGRYRQVDVQESVCAECPNISAREWRRGD